MNEIVETYIESRLPLEEIGIECRRESSTGLHPPPNRLHVWWARRPLTASRAAVLGTLLPSSLSDKEFLTLLGIKGDPVQSQRASEEAERNGRRLTRNPFDYPRAFTINLEKSQLNHVAELSQKTVGSEEPLILDPMAGGGSIPLEALRSGARVLAAEYNPVAHVILKATIEYPIRFGEQLSEEIHKWALWVGERARKDLGDFFPSQANEIVLDYLWSRTVRCPSCSLIVPLSPNWWLSRQKGKKERIGVRPRIPAEGRDEVGFEILDINKHPSYDPSKGTISKGKASCPRCTNTILDVYIKQEAQHGRLGHQLFAVLVKKKTGPKKWERTFRIPSHEDINAYEKAVGVVVNGAFAGSELVPKEQRYKGPADRSVVYGITHWDKTFNPRQLLTHATYMCYILEAKNKIFEELGRNNGRAVALVTYLSMIFDKCLNYDSCLTGWNPGRGHTLNTFDRHDFAFIWSYGEMNMIPVNVGGFEWAMNQVVEAYGNLCDLVKGVDASKVKVFLGSATEPFTYVNGPVDAVIVDPPYYANVMYAELSDFFYVWIKHVLGDLYPGFHAPLTDKDGEVVANAARFRGLGASAEDRAKEDYRLKMSQTFRQIHRVLKPYGVLVVMFTHKTTEAWDTLATALIDAGFQIRRSWPIRTESEHSLNIAKKNAVKSTIFLVARKREGDAIRGWWEQEVYPEIEKVAQAKTVEFERRNIKGVDLYISTFGPVLEVFSRYLEVKSMTGDMIRPEQALDVARRVVTNRTFEKLVPGGAAGIDEATEFYILAMHFYHARQFPFDEARKLAISVGSDPSVLRDQQHVIGKKSEDVVVLDAFEREHSGFIDPEKPRDKPLIDAIHLAELALQRGGMRQYQILVQRLNLDTNSDYRVALEALSRALPDADPEKKAIASLLLQMPESRAKGSKLEDYQTPQD